MSLKRCSVLVVIALCLAVVGFAQNTSFHSRHVVVVMEENRSISIASEYMPYLKSLAQQYSQGMQVYSDSHGSWLAYGELTSGLAPSNGEADNDICSGDGCSQSLGIDNLVRHFAAQGISWRGYFQGLPQTGYLGYQYGMYVRRHNPFAFYSDVTNNAAEQQNIVPLETNLLPDIEGNRLANFTWISPDLDHDAHEGTDDQDALAAADAYLQTFVPQLLQSPPFQPGGDGVLVVTFDEGELAGDNACGGNSDPNNCGGHIWQVVIGPQVKRGYQSNTHYKQANQLRMFCDLLALNSCPGDGANAPSMSEFFPAGVNVSSPTQGETTPSPVNVVASGTGASGTVSRLELWIDGQKIGNYPGAAMNATVTVANGTHSLTVVEVDSTGAYFKSTPVNFTVAQGMAGGSANCAAPGSPGANICSPSVGQTVTSPARFIAAGAGASGEVSLLELWVDGTKIGNYPGAGMNASVTLSVGPHAATVVEVDSQMHYVKSSPVNFTVAQSGGTGLCPAPGSAGAVLCAPVAGAAVSSPVQFAGVGTGASGSVNHLELWIDGNKIGNYAGNAMATQVPLAGGTHAATLVEVDSQARYVKSSPLNFTVNNCSPGQDRTVAICSVQANESTGSPLPIVACARDDEHPITGMVAYANSKVVAQSSNSTLNASVPLSPGQYQLVIRAWDTTGYYFSSQQNVTVK